LAQNTKASPERLAFPFFLNNEAGVPHPTRAETTDLQLIISGRPMGPGRLIADDGKLIPGCVHHRFSGKNGQGGDACDVGSDR
jgi:hypothetical protein